MTLLHTVASMLTNSPYVHLLTLDFSWRFNTVRHSSLSQAGHHVNHATWCTSMISGVFRMCEGARGSGWQVPSESQ